MRNMMTMLSVAWLLTCVVAEVDEVVVWEDHHCEEVGAEEAWEWA